MPLINLMMENRHADGLLSYGLDGEQTVSRA